MSRVVYSPDMIVEMEPWTKYPDLIEEYLSIVATLLRDVRAECVKLHEPEKGDGDWSLGTRVYQRSYFAIREFSKTVDWLRMNTELNALQFSFSIGRVPLRIYKGDPEDPPSRYLTLTPGEEHAIQLSFEFEGIPALDTILRLAVEVDSTRHAGSISLVEIDEFKEVVGVYRIPFESQLKTNITPMKAPPVSIPPAVAVPLKKETAEKKNKETPINAVAK
jgi:hypothetical protein